jgi:hypothetical protein
VQKAFVVNDLVELGRQLGVDRGDRLVDGARQIAIERDRADQRLLDQRLDEFLGTVGLGLLGRRDDLFEEAAGDRLGSGGRGGFGSNLEVGNGSALLLVEAQLTR